MHNHDWDPDNGSLRLAITDPVVAGGPGDRSAAASTGRNSAFASCPPTHRWHQRFRYWAGSTQLQREAERHYDADPSTLGVPPEERARQLKIIHTEGRRLEVDRRNRILTAATPVFNTNPNAFLVEMIKGRTPGTALDVGMGQGRNAILSGAPGLDRHGLRPRR